MSKSQLIHFPEKMDHLDKITELVESMKQDVVKFYDRGEKGLPGIRIRKALREIQNEAKLMSKDILESRNNYKK